MNKKQWYVLGIFFILISFMFMRIADNSCLVRTYNYLQKLNWTEEEISKSIFDTEERTPNNRDVERVVGCVVDEKIYEPFITLCGGLGIICFVLASLEPKQKTLIKTK